MLKLQWDANALEFLHEDFPGSDKMVPVFSVSNVSYDWTKLLVLFSPETGTFHWLSRSGCECCESISTNIKSVDDLDSGTERDLKRVFRAFLTANPDILDAEEKQKVLSKIKKQMLVKYFSKC